MDDPTLIILTGPPGAGKSTIGRLVAAECDLSSCIPSDWFYTTIVNGFIRQWEAESDQQNRAVIGSAMAMAVKMAEAGYFTLIEGVFGPWYLDLIRGEINGHEIKAHYVVLRPDLATCLDRATGRPTREHIKGHPPLTEEHPIRLLWRSFSDLGDYECHVIDNTSLSPAEAARAVVEEVQHCRMVI